MPFQCSICDEPSTRICVRCTKDACENHLCEKCRKCSDCCECEVALDSSRRPVPTMQAPPAAPEPVPESEPADVPDTLAAEPESAAGTIAEPQPAPATHPNGFGSTNSGRLP